LGYRSLLRALKPRKKILRKGSLLYSRLICQQKTHSFEVDLVFKYLVYKGSNLNRMKKCEEERETPNWRRI
jgi:hypothetical protein